MRTGGGLRASRPASVSAASSTASSTASAPAATVALYQVLYTKDKVKKQKSWVDGTLSHNLTSGMIYLHAENVRKGSRDSLYSLPAVSALKNVPDKRIEAGLELDLGAYLVTIEGVLEVATLPVAVDPKQQTTKSSAVKTAKAKAVANETPATPVRQTQSSLSRAGIASAALAKTATTTATAATAVTPGLGIGAQRSLSLTPARTGFTTPSLRKTPNAIATTTTTAAAATTPLRQTQQSLANRTQSSSKDTSANSVSVAVMYSTQKTKKAKSWVDGSLRFTPGTGNITLQLLDANGAVIDRKLMAANKMLECEDSEEIDFPRHVVQLMGDLKQVAIAAAATTATTVTATATASATPTVSRQSATIKPVSITTPMMRRSLPSQRTPSASVSVSASASVSASVSSDIQSNNDAGMATAQESEDELITKPPAPQMQESSAHESLAMVTPAVARQAPLLTSAAPPKINSQITPFRINRPINKASIMSPVTTSASFTSNPGQIDVQFPSVQRCRQLSTFGDKKRIIRKKRAPLQFASLHEYCATYIQLLAEHVQVALDSLGVELRNVINRLSKDAAGGKGAGVAAPVTDEIVRRAGAMIGVRVYPDTVLKLKPATSATTNTAGSPSATAATPVRISGRRSNSFTTSTSPSAHLNNGKHAVYSTVLIELPRKEPPAVAATFNKDDIWIITNSPTFDPSSTFVCRSAFFGISQTNHVELSFIGQRDLDTAEKMAQLSKRTSTNIKVSGNGNNNKRMMASMMDGGDDCDDMIGLIRTPNASSVGKWQQMEVIALRLADMSSDWTMIDKLVSLLSLSSDHNGPIADPPNVPSIIKALISPPSIPPIIPVSKSSVDIMAPLKKDGLDRRINQAILDCVYDRIIADGCREYQLNPEQEAAAARALRAFHNTTCRFFSSKYNNDSTTDEKLNEPQAMLIHGPFGTGKSTLIAVVIILALRLATEIESHFQQQQKQQQKQKHTSSSESNANLSNDNDSDDEALEQMEYIHKRQAVLDKKDAQSARSRLRIMVTSFTNIAVDRVLHCLLDRGFDDFVRIGSVKRMSRRVLPYAIRSSVSSSSGRSVPSSSSATSATSTADNADIRDLEAMLKDPSTPASELPVIRQALQRFKASGHRDLASNAFLVCCTCLSSASEVINGLHFAATIIDEASQVPEPLALVPLTNISTDQLVLVGDPCQLPPMLTTISEFTNQMHIDNGSSNSIKHSNSNSNCGDEDGDNFSSKLTIPLPKGADGLDRTMFDRLAALNFPITQLRTQYRCHPSISLLSNSLFYSSQLHDGVDHSAREPLVMGLPPVVFLDIADGKESKPPGSKSFINKREVDVVGQLIECLTKKAGVESDKVGVISFYKGQADAIEARITGTDKESNKAGTGSGGVLKALKTISTPTVRRSAGLSRKKIKVDSTATATATATDNTTTTEEHDGEKQPQQHQQSHVRVSTVDAFQGDEFDIVILTTTRTDSIGFIDASNRVNVALSRARRHLIVTCNVDLLTTKSKLWRSVIEKTMPKEEATIGPVREARSFIADLNALQSQLPQPSSQRPSQPPSVVSELSDPGSDIVDNDINNDMENDDGDVEESHSLQTQSTSIQMPDFSHIPESVSDVEEYSPDDTDSRIRVDDEADDADADADADADTDESRGDVINIAPRLSTQVRRQRMIDTLLQSVVRRDIGTAIEARKRPAVFDEEDEDEEDEENEENAGEDDEKDDDDGGGVIWQSSKLDKESDEMDEDAEDEDDDENYEEGDSQLRFLEIEEY